MIDPENIKAESLVIGPGTFVHPTARITGPDGGPARRVVLGDHCYIGENVQIRCPDFSLGDFSKIHHHTNVHGYLPCHIGHNAWIGQYCLIDSIGGTTIGNNCGIGAHSQLWSHIKFGDTLEGCRFLSESPLRIGHDVWFVGHCIVSPIVAEDRAMALVGSVVTSNMAFNTIYAGCPAAEISSKIGPQFQPIPIEEKLRRLEQHLLNSGVDRTRLRIVTTPEEIAADGCTYFILSTRTYTKRSTPEEIGFMKYLLPERGKFTPHPAA